MAELEIAFEWQVDDAGYRLADVKHNVAVVPKGGTRRSHRPLEYNETLFRQFADLRTPAACVKFAERFGLLGIQKRRDGAESVILWLAEAEDLRQAIAAFEQDPASLIVRYGDYCSAEIDARLRAGEPNGRPALGMRPKSLLGAIKLQFMRHASSGNSLRECERCGQWFTIGVGGRRRDARFCSDKCSVDFHNQRRAKGSRK